MLFVEHSATLVAVYGNNFTILQTIKPVKSALNKESLYEISSKLDKEITGGISYSCQIVFFQFLHYTSFFGTICPLQVPGLSSF